MSVDRRLTGETREAGEGVAEGKGEGVRQVPARRDRRDRGEGGEARNV